ncbi:Cingulin [Dissostichus eleginoides]|uniref:Cingulin n=1 Tax=Dissostichus eleginoides TaxID=100907 RepID=A0AAD9BBK1_DISEL|nr:Cingulin [Dissostichus eleginoides]
MSSLSTDRKPLVDYGVQIRFIKDLHDTGGGFPDKSKVNGSTATPPSSKYGVAVRVQGISGQPYVVLKDGQKGDSYGVQLNTPTSSSGPPSPCNSLPKINREPAGLTNPYSTAVNTARSHVVSPVQDEVGEIFGSPHKRPPGDGQAGTQGEEEGGAGRQGERSKPEFRLKATASDAKEKTRDGSDEEYNEAGLKRVKLNGVTPKGVPKPVSGYCGSLGRYSGKKQINESSSELFPEPPAATNEEPIPAIDTNSLAPINKLISKFNSGTPSSAPQTRGRTGARQRLRFDERRRSRSLDARQDVQAEVPSPSSPTFNPYAIPLSTSSYSLASSAPASSSLGSSTASKGKMLEAPKTSFKSPGTFVAKNNYPALAKKPEISQRSQIKEVTNGEEAQVKQAIYNILKEGTSESERSLKRKVNLVYDTTGSFKEGGSDGSYKKENLEELQEQLKRCKKELQQVHNELAEERMAREGAESRVRLQEDQLAELQEDLRRVSENSTHSDSLQTADLSEANMLRRRQEEILHQRERELTALKGALKEEVECHDREMEALREQYSQDMDNLRTTMEQVTQSQEQIEEERERVNTSMFTLEQELDNSRDQEEQWKNQLNASTRICKPPEKRAGCTSAVECC